MKKIGQDSWYAIYPFLIVLVILAGLLALRSNVSFPDLALAVAAVIVLAGGVLSIPIVIYHLTAKRSKQLAVALYYALILISAWIIAPGLRWELGYNDFIRVLLVGLLVYGGTAIWSLSRPTFVRMLPSALLALTVLMMMFY